MLTKSPSLRKWGLSIDFDPKSIETYILSAPQIENGEGHSKPLASDTLRKLPIQKPVTLNKDQWIFAYNVRNFKPADKLWNCL